VSPAALALAAGVVVVGFCHRKHYFLPGQWKETVKTAKNRQKLQTSFNRFNIIFILVAALFLASFRPLY